MNIAQALRTQCLHDFFDAQGDQLRALDFVVLDVHEADAQGDLRIEIGEDVKFVIAAPRKFQHQVVGVQRIEKRNQITPEATQHRLSAVVAEADVHRAFVEDAVEHVVDRIGGPGRILRIAGDTGFVELNSVGFHEFNLTAQDTGNIHGQLGNVFVEAVGHHAREHVWSSARELQRSARELGNEFIVAREVERAFANLADHHAGGEQPLAGSAVGTITVEIRRSKVAADPLHLRHKIVHHAVRLRMAGIKANQLSIRDQVEACQFLGLEHGHDGIPQHEAGSVTDQPRRNRVAADHRGFDACGHRISCMGARSSVARHDNPRCLVFR